jgi:hypothetical protein
MFVFSSSIPVLSWSWSIVGRALAPLPPPTSSKPQHRLQESPTRFLWKPECPCGPVPICTDYTVQTLKVAYTRNRIVTIPVLRFGYEQLYSTNCFVFWDITQWSLVKFYGRFGGVYPPSKKLHETCSKQYNQYLLIDYISASCCTVFNTS